MAWTQTFDDVFTSDPVVSPAPSPGSITNWTDVYGSAWGNSASGLTGTSINRLTYPYVTGENAALLTRPIASVVGQRMVLKFIQPGPTGAKAALALRVQDSLNYYFFAVGNAGPNYYHSINFVGAGILNPPNNTLSLAITTAGQYVPIVGDAYILDCYAIGSSPTTLSMSLFHVATSLTVPVMTLVTNDTRGTALQIPGQPALIAYSPLTQGVSSTTGIYTEATTFEGTPPVSDAFTFTGPASGQTAVASSLFTVTPDNTGPTANTIVTPASDQAGSFSPSTVTFLAGSTAAKTFSYTPGTSTTATLSVTNNGGLTNPASLSYVSSSPMPAKIVNNHRIRANKMGQLRSNFAMQLAAAQSITSAGVLAVPQALNANFGAVFNTVAKNGSNVAIAGGITNGGTGPTVPATVSLMGSIDGTNWYEISSFLTTVGAGVSSTFSFQSINDGWPMVGLYVHGNSDQAVVLNAVLCAAVNYS